MHTRACMCVYTCVCTYIHTYVYIHICIYIYIYIEICLSPPIHPDPKTYSRDGCVVKAVDPRRLGVVPRKVPKSPLVGRGDDTVGNPHRAQISQFELFELILLLKFDKAPYRAIRGNSISVSSTLPPLLFQPRSQLTPKRSRAPALPRRSATPMQLQM